MFYSLNFRFNLHLPDCQFDPSCKSKMFFDYIQIFQMQNLGRLRHNLGTFYLSIRPCSTKNITAVSEDDYIGEDVRAIKTE